MPRTQDVNQHDHDHGALLRAAGLRVTPVRLAVLRLLCQSSGALSADQVVEELDRVRSAKGRGRGADRVTVYRTLNSLVEAGIAHKVDPGDRVFRFALAGDHARHVPGPGEPCGCGASEKCGHPEPPLVVPRPPEGEHGHPHFMCETCGKVECLEDTEVVLQPRGGGDRPAVRKSIRQQEVLLRGTCDECGPETGKP